MSAVGGTAEPRQDRRVLAILMMAAAFFCFTLVDSSAKWLAGAGLPALQVAFLRYAGHFAISVAVFVPQHGWGVFRSNAPWWQLARAITLLMGTTLNFIAVAYLPLTITTAVFFAAPIMVCLLAVPILGERIGLVRFSAVVVGFGGVLVITRPWGADFHWAMLCSLGALLAASFYFVLTRVIAGRDNNPTGQLITAGLPTLILSPVIFTGWVWPASAIDWMVTLAVGGVAALGHSLVTVASRFAEASTLAPLVYMQIIYVTIISWAVFAEPPDRATILGTAIIVASGIFIWWRERRVRSS